MKQLLFLLALPLAAAPAFKPEYMFELELATKRTIMLAEAVPAEKYTWRPAEKVRSIGEVYVHIAEANALLLGLAGVSIPQSEYAGPRFSGKESDVEVVRRNLEFEKSVQGKPEIIGLLRRTLDAVRANFEKSKDSDLEKAADFFGRKTTVRAIYIRIIAHINEHLGQSIAYARVNGIAPPWAD